MKKVKKIRGGHDCDKENTAWTSMGSPSNELKFENFITDIKDETKLKIFKDAVGNQEYNQACLNAFVTSLDTEINKLYNSQEYIWAHNHTDKGFLNGFNSHYIQPLTNLKAFLLTHSITEPSIEVSDTQHNTNTYNSDRESKNFQAINPIQSVHKKSQDSIKKQPVTDTIGSIGKRQTATSAIGSTVNAKSALDQKRRQKNHGGESRKHKKRYSTR